MIKSAIFALTEVFMKKILCALLVLASLLCFASCGEAPSYPAGTSFYLSSSVVTDSVQTYAVMSYYNDLDQKAVEIVRPYADNKVGRNSVSITEYTYNAAGLVDSRVMNNFTTGLKVEQTIAYNDNGDVIERVTTTTESGKDPVISTYTAEYTYDAQGRVLTLVENSDGTEVSATYVYVSADKNDCTVTYVIGETTTTGRQIYDKNGDLFVKVDAEGNTTKYRYTYTKTDFDKDGTFEKTLTELVTYDEWEAVKTKTTYTYDKYGCLVSVNTIDGDNKVIQKYSHKYSAEKPVYTASR